MIPFSGTQPVILYYTGKRLAISPSINSCSQSTGTQSLSTTVTIAGSKFSTTAVDNTVVIGGTSCVVQSATATSITCDVGNGQKGSYEVEVTVSGLGLAAHPEGAPVMFTYVADVDSISPTSGSTEGLPMSCRPI